MERKEPFTLKNDSAASAGKPGDSFVSLKFLAGLTRRNLRPYFSSGSKAEKYSNKVANLWRSHLLPLVVLLELSKPKINSIRRQILSLEICRKGKGVGKGSVLNIDTEL